MQSDFTVRQISRGNGPAVHRYYDVAIEEPDGERLLYFEFDSDEIPGPGKIIVADADGGNPREVGRSEEAIGHVGGNATWVGPGRIAFTPRQLTESHAIVRAIDGGAPDVELPADLRSFHEGTGVAILLGDSGYAQPDRYAGRQMLRTWNVSGGEPQPLLTAEQAHNLHPEKGRFDLSKTNFQNPKWSPDGSTFFVVFGTEVYRKSSNAPDYPRIKSLIYGRADGSDLRYLGEFGHHPMWHPDGTGILAHNVRKDGGQDLQFYPIDGGALQMVFPDLPGVHCTPDRACRRLVTDIFDYENQKAQIALFDIQTRKKTLLAEGSQANFDHVTGCHPHPQWSRDEKRIFFNMADTGQSQLYVLEL